MSDFTAQLKLIYGEPKVPPGHEDSRRIQRYQIVAVHGLGHVDHPEDAWTGGQEAWISDLLPLHSQCTSVTRFDYSFRSLGTGVSVSNVQSLAKILLDELLKLTHDSPDRIVFIGHDLGGLVIKQALSIALAAHQYRHISAMTSLLVFFATPHRVRSLESVASWMLFVAGEDRDYELSWFSKTARMVETINAMFEPFKMIYKSISVFGTHPTGGQTLENDGMKWRGLDVHSATMGVPGERMIDRNEPHSRLAIFSLEEDPAFEAIYQEVNRSKSPAYPFINCLEHLALFFQKESMGLRPNVLQNCSSSRQALEQLKNNSAYQSWSVSRHGTILIQGYLDADSILDLLQTAPHHKVTTIRCNIKSKSHMHDSAQLPAFLCHQLLCQAPQLFPCVQLLAEHLFTEATNWPDKLWLLLHSLLTSPVDGVVVCFVQDAEETPDGCLALRKLLSFANDVRLPFKLIMAAVPGHAVKDELKIPDRNFVAIRPTSDSFETTVKWELDTLVRRRPDLFKIRQHVECALIGRYRERTSLLGLSETSMVDVVQSWIALLGLQSSPATRSSIQISAANLPDALYGVYAELLQSCKASPGGLKSLRALFWSSRALRPLSAPQLGVAAALDLNTQERSDVMDEIPLNLAWDINMTFTPLAHISNDQVMTLHDSFARFLALPHYGPCEQNCLLCHDNHSVMALKCLHYIALLDDSDYFTSQLESGEGNNSPYSLLEYAVKHWPQHYKLAKKATRESPDPLPEFEVYFHDEVLIRKWAHFFCSFPHPFKQAVWVDPMLVSVEVGCVDLVKTLLKLSSRGSDVLGTALEVALGNGDEELVSLFSDSGATSANALHLAALSGSLTMLSFFPHEKDDLASVGTQGLTPLHFACQGGSLEMVATLLENGADMNAKSQETGSTPLHLACQYGHAGVISLLLEKGAGPNAEDRTGMTPLHAATTWQQPLAVRALLKSAVSVDLNTTVLHTSAGTGRLDILELIIDHCTRTKGPDEDDTITALLSGRDGDGATPLHRAASEGHTDVVRALLSMGESSGSGAVLVSDHRTCLPLHLAARSGHLEVVNCLLEQGETAEQLLAEEETGAYAIHLAVLHGHIDVVKRLCEAHENAKVSLSLFYGEETWSPLHLAVNDHQVDMVKDLLSSGATPNIMDASNATPLFYACQSGQLEILELLLQYEASVDTQTVKNSRDVSPLLAATQNKHPRVVKRLIEANASLNTQDESGKTILMAACESGDVRVVRWLLDAGADAVATDGYGRQALHIAAKYVREDIIEALLEIPNVDPCSTDYAGNTPLHLAVQSTLADPIPAINVLIRHGAQPDLKNEDEQSPLDLAKTEQVAIILAKAATLDESPESTAFQKRLLQVSAKKGWLKIIEALHDKGSDVYMTIRDEQDRSLYHMSAMNGQIDVVRYLISMSIPGYDGNDASKRTPVSYAAKFGHFEVLKVFAEAAPESLNKSDDYGDTPLSYAVKNRHIEMAKYLLENKETFSIRFEADDNEGEATRTLYHLAADGSDGLSDMVELLLAHNVPGYDGIDERGRAPVTYAAMYGNVEIARILGRVASDSLNQIDEDGKTPLFHAVEHGREQVVEYLVGEGVNLDVPSNQSGWTALHQAAQDGREKMVKTLLRSNVSKDVQDTKKRTPLYLAAFQGHVETASALIDSNANVHLADEDGWEPVFVAYDNRQILEMLLDSGVNVDAKNDGGLTALHGAASGYKDSVTLLLDRGANPLAATDELWTPLHYAASNASDSALIELLLQKVQEKEGNPDVKDHKGYTPLMIALAEGSHTAVKTLLESGLFDVNCVNNDGQSTVELAIERSSRSFLELLVQYGGFSLAQQQLVQVLAWATRGKHSDLQRDAIDLALKKGSLEPSQFDELFDIAVGRDDPPLIEFLFTCEPTTERRDAHGWTLQQIHASFCLEQTEAGPDENHLGPTGWNPDHKARELIIDEKRLAVHRDEGEEGVSVCADHPVPLRSKFYFEVEILNRSSDYVGIGFGYQDCDVQAMPGWNMNTWGVHADNGGFYHADGWFRFENSEWMYDTGDVIGCCIDLGQRRAFYTKNGIDIGPCFASITGRVFPIVSLGAGDRVLANFGQTTVPFHHSNGRDREYRVEEEIASESYRIDA